MHFINRNAGKSAAKLFSAHILARVALLAFLFTGVFACTNDLDLLYQEQQMALTEQLVAEPVEPVEPEPETPWWKDVDTTNTRQDSSFNCGPYCA